jgi:hypothetical protein
MPSIGSRRDASQEEPQVPGRGDHASRARRRAGLGAAVAGLALVPYFWIATATVGWPADDAPPVGAPATEFVRFYVEGFSRIPLTATVAIGHWALWLVLLVSVVRAACRDLDLAAILSITLAGASTAVYVAAEGVLAWPTVGMTADEISENLDPGVAKAIVLSRDGLHAAAGVTLGISLLVVSWLLTRSDLWGHWLLAVVGFGAGVSACTSTVVGPDGIGAGAVLLWGLAVAVVILGGRGRSARAAGTARCRGPRTPP